MKIGFRGNLEDKPQVKAGFIGAGSHSFRNLYPVFQFAPVDLRAVCDLDLEKAQAFADQFGASGAYTDYIEMIEKEDLDAVFICTGYDKEGRPLYPKIGTECLEKGVHVWIEKPPASSCAEIEMMQKAADDNGKNVVCGMKKMFFPANEKAERLMNSGDIGKVQTVTIQYPQRIPAVEELKAYIEKKEKNGVVGFLDHLCHPASLMVFLLGMPETLYYERSQNGAGAATFTYQDGTVAVIALTFGSSPNGGMEQTMVVGEKGHITVENNTAVTLQKQPHVGYGNQPDYYVYEPAKASVVWKPEFSLGQLYNKGLFLLGYYGEINEFARSILEDRKPLKGTLEQAWQVTRIFEGFAEGPGKKINL